jgi:hypothetical protein
LALAFEVGETEYHFPRPPGAVDSQEAFPIIYLAREMLGRKDSRRGHHHEFDIGDGHARPFRLFLCILHHEDELGNAIRLHVILRHIRAEGDHVDGMQPPTVGVEEGHDVNGCDLGLEGIGVFEIVVPDLVNDIAEKFGDTTLGHFVTGVVIEAGFMGRLCTNPDDCRGVVGDVFIVEGEVGGMYKYGVAMFSFVLGGLREDGREGVDSIQLIVGNDHEERKKRFPDGKQVIISWFPFERGKGVVCLFEEAGDGVRCHVEMKLKEKLLRSSFLGYSRAGAVENCDDDDQSNCVGKGELRVIGVFGDSP